MTEEVRFYFGVESRYSYLAATRMRGLEAETGWRVRWRPLTTWLLLERRGRSPFADAVSGQYDWDYRRRDAEDWAAYYGVPYREPPDPLKTDQTLHRRLALACTAAAGAGAARAYSMRILKAMFVDRAPDLSDRVLAAHAAAVGLDGRRLLARLDAPETAAALEATVADALAEGAFGVPSFGVGDRLFWGNDRLPLVAHAIRRR